MREITIQKHNNFSYKAQFYPIVSFTSEELFSILLVALIEYEENLARVTIDDILEKLESRNNYNFEAIDDKCECMSKNRIMLLERKINKVLKTTGMYSDGWIKDIDGAVRPDTNIYDIIKEHFVEFMI